MDKEVHLLCYDIQVLCEYAQKMREAQKQSKKPCFDIDDRRHFEKLAENWERNFDSKLEYCIKRFSNIPDLQQPLCYC